MHECLCFYKQLLLLGKVEIIAFFPAIALSCPLRLFSKQVIKTALPTNCYTNFLLSFFVIVDWVWFHLVWGIVWFNTDSNYVVRAKLQLIIILPQPHNCCDFRHIPAHLPPPFLQQLCKFSLIYFPSGTQPSLCCSSCGILEFQTTKWLYDGRSKYATAVP